MVFLGGELLRLSRVCPPSLCHALRISRINGRSNGFPSDAQKPIHAILVLLSLSWSAQSCLHISIRAFADDMFSRSLECANGSEDDGSLDSAAMAVITLLIALFLKAAILTCSSCHHPRTPGNPAVFIKLLHAMS